MINLNVAGITFQRDRNPTIATLRPAGAVSFVADPDNNYDSGAVKVVYKDILLGYVPKGDLQVLALEKGLGTVHEYKYLNDSGVWNSDHDGALQSITLSIDVEEEEKSGRVVGGKYMRVTTFLGYFDPYGGGDGLIKWAFDQSDNYDGYKAALNKAAEDGTELHTAIQSYLENEPYDADYMPEGWAAFEKKYEPELISAEVRFWDSTLMVTGQYDFLGYITVKGARVLALLDWKSSKKPNEKHKIQASIYASNVEFDGESPDMAMVVAFGAENKQRFSVAGITKEQIKSNYIGMLNVRAGMDSMGIWIPEEKFYYGK